MAAANICIDQLDLADNSDVQELFSCDICQNKYNDDDRKAKMLFCHHTFCSQCLEMIFTQQGRVTLTCPTCKEVSNLASVGIESLRGNHYLHQFSDILEELARTLKPSEIQENHVEITDKDQVCEKHDNTKRLFWCSDCCQAICCHCQVLDHNINQGHGIKDIKEASSSIVSEILNHQSDLGFRVKKIEDARDFVKRSKFTSQYEIIAGLDNLVTEPTNKILLKVSELSEMTYKSKSIFTEKEELEKLSLPKLKEVLESFKLLAVEFGQIESTIESLFDKIFMIINSKILITIIENDANLDTLHCALCGQTSDQGRVVKAEDKDNDFKINTISFKCSSCQVSSSLFGSEINNSSI